MGRGNDNKSRLIGGGCAAASWMLFYWNLIAAGWHGQITHCITGLQFFHSSEEQGRAEEWSGPCFQGVWYILKGRPFYLQKWSPWFAVLTYMQNCLSGTLLLERLWIYWGTVESPYPPKIQQQQQKTLVYLVLTFWNPTSMHCGPAHHSISSPTQQSTWQLLSTCSKHRNKWELIRGFPWSLKELVLPYNPPKLPARKTEPLYIQISGEWSSRIHTLQKVRDIQVE